MNHTSSRRKPGGFLTRWVGAAIVVVAPVLGAGGCAGYRPFDAGAYLDQRIESRVPEDLRGRVEVPFRLEEDVVAAVEGRLSPAGSERRRTDEVLDFIFGYLDLQYSLTPTRDASGTFRSREGNCLSFVNLFVGIARHQRLNPFYVEVKDYQRWNYKDGVVVSRGHIVAGINVDGELATYDFLPYRPKSYRDFQPIDDLTAMAHYYNNLGAEDLMEGNIDRAEERLTIANRLAPAFEKALNNLGIIHLRRGDPGKAVELYERELAKHADNVAFMTNLVRAYQELGREADAQQLLVKLEGINEGNPFFYVYRGEWALGQGDAAKALEYMRQALRIDSEVPEVHVGLVKVYIALGELEKARYHVERALRLDATHAEARQFASILEGTPAAPDEDR